MDRIKVAVKRIHIVILNACTLTDLFPRILDPVVASSHFAVLFNAPAAKFVREEATYRHVSVSFSREIHNRTRHYF